ncbi:MAG: 30S ribosomal protein S17 [Planctomycetota bacterium]
MSESTEKSSRPLLGTKVGVVTSDKRDQTRTVEVAYQVKHPKYGKYLKRSQKFQVHDPKNESKQGDRVQIGSCRPISKTKSWRLVRVVESAPAPVASID